MKIDDVISSIEGCLTLSRMNPSRDASDMYVREAMDHLHTLRKLLSIGATPDDTATLKTLFNKHTHLYSQSEICAMLCSPLTGRISKAPPIPTKTLEY